MDVHGGHADGGSGREDVVVVADGLVGADALEAVSDAVADAEGFEVDGCEVRKFF